MHRSNSFNSSKSNSGAGYYQFSHLFLYILGDLEIRCHQCTPDGRYSSHRCGFHPRTNRTRPFPHARLRWRSEGKSAHFLDRNVNG